MIRNKAKIKGKLTLVVRDADGTIKRYDWKRRIWNIFRYFKFSPLMIAVNHNIVTDEGDAMIADLMAESPARNKVNNTNGRLPVGTNWTGTTPKANTWVNTQTGTAKVLSATYPKLKGSFGAADDNVVQYRAQYVAGDLNATITEAGLANAATSAGDLLAYAQVTPSVVVAVTDSLQIDWELTILGA